MIYVIHHLVVQIHDVTMVFVLAYRNTKATLIVVADQNVF